MTRQDQEQAPSGRSVYTPSRLNREVRALLEGGFPELWIEGEISNLFRARSGHSYFTLKDDGAQLKCALFRQRNAYGRFAPEEGQQVLLRGRLSLYEPRGEFQLIVDYLEDAGEGRLRRAFEALRAKLAAEGLFDAARKRPLPRFPRRIAVVTSPDGAAIRDVIAVVGRRYPAVQLLLVPSLVQGTEAPAQLRQALARAAALAPDAILLTRGGGSLEDLRAFNDEGLARDLAALAVPTVCAVGHESDFCIAELVADQRGATPSAAAELLVPDAAALRRVLHRQAQALSRVAMGRLRAEGARLAQWQARLHRVEPRRETERRAQRLDELLLRLGRALDRCRQRAADRAGALDRRLRALHPERRLGHCDDRARALSDGLLRAFRNRTSKLAARQQAARARLAPAARALIAARQARRDRLDAGLRALSPEAVLQRGFSLTVREDSGEVLSSPDTVAPGERIRTRLAGGELLSRVEEAGSPGRRGSR